MKNLTIKTQALSLTFQLLFFIGLLLLSINTWGQCKNWTTRPACIHCARVNNKLKQPNENWTKRISRDLYVINNNDERTDSWLRLQKGRNRGWTNGFDGESMFWTLETDTDDYTKLNGTWPMYLSRGSLLLGGFEPIDQLDFGMDVLNKGNYYGKGEIYISSPHNGVGVIEGNSRFAKNVGLGLNTLSNGTLQEVMQIQANGKVLINTSLNPVDATLRVNGGVTAHDFRVKSNCSWSDFVFEEDYELETLQVVNEYINTKKHLPGLPTEEQVRAEGYRHEEMHQLLLQKIEELYLYTIEQNNKLKDLGNEDY